MGQPLLMTAVHREGIRVNIYKVPSDCGEFLWLWKVLFLHTAGKQLMFLHAACGWLVEGKAEEREQQGDKAIYRCEKQIIATQIHYSLFK